MSYLLGLKPRVIPAVSAGLKSPPPKEQSDVQNSREIYSRIWCFQ